MRGTETIESLLARVNKASYEISFKHHFDQIIVNDDLTKACREAEKAIMDFLGNPDATGTRSPSPNPEI